MLASRSGGRAKRVLPRVIGFMAIRLALVESSILLLLLGLGLRSILLISVFVDLGVSVHFEFVLRIKSRWEIFGWKEGYLIVVEGRKRSNWSCSKVCDMLTLSS